MGLFFIHYRVSNTWTHIIPFVNPTNYLNPLGFRTFGLIVLSELCNISYHHVS